MMPSTELLKLAKLDPQDFEVFEEVVSREALIRGCFIADLTVPKEKRNLGHGSRALSELLAGTDAQGVVIFLQAYPYELYGDEFTNELFEAGRARLVAFYARFGFKHLGGGWMYRLPYRQALRRSA